MLYISGSRWGRYLPSLAPSRSYYVNATLKIYCKSFTTSSLIQPPHLLYKLFHRRQKFPDGVKIRRVRWVDTLKQRLRRHRNFSRVMDALSKTKTELVNEFDEYGTTVSVDPKKT